jgi:hypothetical protein
MMHELQARIESYLRYNKIPRTIEPQDGRWFAFNFDPRDLYIHREGITDWLLHDIHRVIVGRWSEYHQVRVVNDCGTGKVYISQGD